MQTHQSLVDWELIFICTCKDLDVIDRNSQLNSKDEIIATANGKVTSCTTNANSFEEQYTLGKIIGSGTFSVVRIAVHKPTGQRYAIKCIKREGLVAEDIEALTTEVAILKQVSFNLTLGVIIIDILNCP